MGVDDGHGPRASTNGPPPLPCAGVVVSGPLLPPDLLPSEVPSTGQMGDRSSYAVAGMLLVAAAGALAGVLLALVALHAYSGARRRRSRDRLRLRHSLPSISGGADHGGVEPSPRGLDPAVLRALPVVAAGDGAGDCAVCLAGLERGEEARALPRCGHRFHVGCIDAWFRGNSTCPLCRADVEAPSNDAEVRVDVETGDAAVKGGAPAMRRLSSGTDLDKTRRAFASTRSASF